jgi:hypothetical protein
MSITNGNIGRTYRKPTFTSENHEKAARKVKGGTRTHRVLNQSGAEILLHEIETRKRNIKTGIGTLMSKA